jgi:hypothetical protein
MTIFLSAMSAVLVFYFGECVKRARQRKTVATHIEGYLFNWFMDIFDQDEDMKKIASFGRTWGEKYFEKLDSKGMIDLEKKYKEKLEELKTNDSIQEALAQIAVNIREKIESKPSLVKYAYSVFHDQKRDLLDGKIFPSDNDLSYLPPNMAKLALRLKLKTVEYNDHALLIYHFTKDGGDEKELSERVWELGEKWILLIRDRTILAKHCEAVTSTPTLSMALDMMYSWD